MPPPVPTRPLSVAARVCRMFGRGSRIVIILVIGGCVAENYRGHYVWKKYRREWEAKGERFDLAAFIPKPVPPDQNFAATAFFAPFLDYTIDEKDPEHLYHWKDKETYERNRALAGFPNDARKKKASDAGQWQLATFSDLKLWRDYFDGNTNFPFAAPPKDPASDVLTALRRYDAVLDELHAAGTRPYSVFPVHYTEGFRAALPHLATIKSIAEVSCLRALAYLETGNSDAALRDAKFVLRLAEALKSESFLISQLVRIRLIEMALQPAWEGLARKQWNKSQVLELQGALASIDLLGDYGPTMRTERAAVLHLVELQRTGRYKSPARAVDGEEERAEDFTRIRFLPGGVFRQNQFTIAWRYQNYIIPIVDTNDHQIDVWLAKRIGNVREGTRFHPYALLANLLTPHLSGYVPSFARGQTWIDLARIACALEQHRLSLDRYPDSLEALAPRFLSKVPVDVITGELPRYRRTRNGRFVLYSVGWNERDDNGEVGRKYRLLEGDWVWRYPAESSVEAGP